MKLLEGWIIKAERDLESAKKLSGGDNPFFDTAIESAAKILNFVKQRI
jgi:HEPN domain-containing protein